MPEEQYKEFLSGLGKYFASVKNRDLLASVIKAIDLSYSHIDSVYTELFYAPRIFNIVPGTMRGWNVFDLSVIKATITVDSIDYYVYNIPFPLYKVYSLYKSILENSIEIPEKDEFGKFNFFVNNRTDTNSELAIKKSIIGEPPDNIKFIYTSFYRVQEYKIFDTIGSLVELPKSEDSDDYLNRASGLWYTLFNRKNVYNIWIAMNILMKFPISYEDGVVTEVGTNYIKINNNEYNLSGFENYLYLLEGDNVKRFQPLTMAIFTTDVLINQDYKLYIDFDDMKKLGYYRTGKGRIVEPKYLYTDVKIEIGEHIINTVNNKQFINTVLDIENKDVSFGNNIFRVPCYVLDGNVDLGETSIEVFPSKEKIMKYNFRIIVNSIYKIALDYYDIDLMNKIKPIYSYLIWRFVKYMQDSFEFYDTEDGPLSQHLFGSITLNFHPMYEIFGGESYYEWDGI